MVGYSPIVYGLFLFGHCHMRIPCKALIRRVFQVSKIYKVAQVVRFGQVAQPVVRSGKEE